MEFWHRVIPLFGGVVEDRGGSIPMLFQMFNRHLEPRIKSGLYPGNESHSKIGQLCIATVYHPRTNPVLTVYLVYINGIEKPPPIIIQNHLQLYQDMHLRQPK